MKHTPSVYRVSFDTLHTHFNSLNEQQTTSDPDVGTGLVRVFKVEKGLQAKAWDCTSAQALELFYEADEDTASAYFTLAFFLQREALQFANSRIPFQENIIWDTLFISSASCLRMYVPPNTRIHCLTVSFSKKWLGENLLLHDDRYEALREKVASPDGFIILEYMHASERPLIRALVDDALHEPVPLFYIKSCVLKIASDFFNKIKEKETLGIINNELTARTLNTTLAETERLLDSHITGRLPDLKDLACQHGLSESTLKRYFKRKHGINLSAYFLEKKMEYARKLIREDKMSLPDAAHLIGYKNINYFLATYDKHFNTAPDLSHSIQA